MSRRRPPVVELLEDRLVPALFSAGNGAELAAAIAAANANGQADTIRVTQNIVLTQALPAFTADGGRAVTLQGNGFTLSRSGPAAFRLLDNTGATLAVERLTVTGGVADVDGGGGIINRAGGQLLLDRVVVSGNQAVGNTVGGGVYNMPGAVINLRDSWLTGNVSATFGGGMRNQGHVLLVEGCTFSGNTAIADGGGGICNFFGGQIDLIRNTTFTGNVAVRGAGICNHNKVSLVNCTLVGNRAQLTGGGIENDATIPTLINCIVAGNSPDDLFPNAPLFASHNLIGGNPLVGELKDNGGPTPTLALLAGSPALGAGTPVGAPSTDQRDYPRPPAGPIDIGAYQSEKVIAVGGGDQVRLFDAATGLEVGRFQHPAGSRVAVGDVTGDGVADYVTAAGPDQAGFVEVWTRFDAPVRLTRFRAFRRGYRGGVSVAVGNLDADAALEIVVGQAGGGSLVKVFDLKANGEASLKARFRAFGPSYLGGVTVAVGNVFGAANEILVGAAEGPARVRAFDPSGSVTKQFRAFGPAFTGGVNVAAADLDGDGRSDLIAGQGGRGRLVRVFTSGQTTASASLAPFGRSRVGVTVSGLDVNGDRRAEIVTAPATGGDSAALVFDFATLAVVDELFASPGGLRIGAGAAP